MRCPLYGSHKLYGPHKITCAVRYMGHLDTRALYLMGHTRALYLASRYLASHSAELMSGLNLVFIHIYIP